MGTSRNSTSSSCLRVVASGRLRPSSRSHRSGARSRTSTDSGTADVATNATPTVATALRSSLRIKVATGSAGVGRSASMSVISSTPPPSRTLATADATLLSRSSARSAPTSGPSSSTRRRPAHTVRTIVALPTPAGPDTSTPRLAVAPRVLSRSGSSIASFSHSVRRLACACEPLRSSKLTVGARDSAGVVTTCWPDVGCAERVTTPSDVTANVAPSPQITTEFGCTLTGPAGSTPVTVNSSDVHVMPTADVSALLAADDGMSGPRSRGNSDTVSPTVITLPSRA